MQNVEAHSSKQAQTWRDLGKQNWSKCYRIFMGGYILCFIWGFSVLFIGPVFSFRSSITGSDNFIITGNSSKPFHEFLKDKRQNADSDIESRVFEWIDNNPIKKHKTITLDPSVGFSACLLVKDDNNRLIEWLAYHHLVLPLRHLVVAIDPDSLTSPEPILNRWDDSDLEIVVWNDEDYLKQDHIVTRMGRKIQAIESGNSTELGELHLERQRVFISKCSAYHKEKDRSWVLLIDSDEYMVYNHIHDMDPQLHPPNPLRKDLPEIGEKTMMDYMNENEKGPWHESDCIGFVRILFGARDVSEKELAKAGSISDFNSQHFDTLRYFQHDVLGAPSHNGHYKSMWNVAELKKSSIKPSKINSIHRPTFSDCQDDVREMNSPGAYQRSLFRIHHYLGSWDAYNTRIDSRRDRFIFDVKGNVSYGTNYDAQPWLKHFIRLVGNTKAQELLAGSGEIRGGKNRDDRDFITPCAILLFGAPRDLKDVVFPSLKTNILDTNPSCHIFVHSYNTTSILKNQNDKSTSVDEFHRLARVATEIRLDTAEESLTEGTHTTYRQWHSLRNVWDILTSYEEDKMIRFSQVGLFPLDIEYIDPIKIKTDDVAVVPAPVLGYDELPYALNDLIFFGYRDIAEIWATYRGGSVEEYVKYVDRKGLVQVPNTFIQDLLVDRWDLTITERKICLQTVSSDIQWVCEINAKEEMKDLNLWIPS